MITIAGVTYGQMADAIIPANLNNLPFVPDALLGYADGRWPDYLAIASQHQGVPCFGLTVFGSLSVGNGVDCEWGDASPWQAAQAIRAEIARGVVRPILYCPQSWAAKCVAACVGLGIDRSQYRLVTAHYQGPTMPGAPTAGMHICGAICNCPVQADATQWNSYPTYDISLLGPGFLSAAPYPGPPPGAAYPSGAPLPSLCVGIATTSDGGGYWQADANGLVKVFGNATSYGDMSTKTLNKPVVGMARTQSGNGYWLAAADGGVFSFGDAPFEGSAGAMTLNKPIVGISPDASGNGYWLVASDGGVFTAGAATFYGSTGAMTLNKPIVGMASTPSGNGYWLAGSDGGIFSFGGAPFHGSTGNIVLNKPVVGMASTPSGNGYWLVASDGGIFTFGDAGFYGSTGNLVLNKPVVGMTPTPSGNGYWLVAADGGIFTFGDAVFHGSGA